MAVALAAVTAVVLFGPVTASLQMSPEARMCGGPNTVVQAEFDLRAAREIWRVFPAMKMAPELEELDGQVHVVVFAGGVDLMGLVVGDGSRPAPVVFDAVCVIPAGGGPPYLYSSVSRAGSDFN